MSERRIVVPAGMLKAALDRWLSDDDERHRTLDRLEAALGWLAENPIVPTEEQCAHLVVIATDANDDKISSREVCKEWQRRMFLAPEPEASEDVKDLLWSYIPDVGPNLAAIREAESRNGNHNRQVVEAFRRGQQSREPREQR